MICANICANIRSSFASHISGLTALFPRHTVNEGCRFDMARKRDDTAVGGGQEVSRSSGQN
jgi:hypothetical protein